MLLKGDLKGFQENFETFLKSICHDLTPVNLRARRDKSHAHFLTNNSSGCQRVKQIQAKWLCNGEIFIEKSQRIRRKVFSEDSGLISAR